MSVCLSRQALELLRELHALTGGGKYLFPNQRDHDKPMSNNAILKALERMGYKGKMTGHGFRALAMSTIKERLGYRHEVVDRQLAHAHKDKVARAYRRLLLETTFSIYCSVSISLTTRLKALPVRACRRLTENIYLSFGFGCHPLISRTYWPELSTSFTKRPNAWKPSTNAKSQPSTS